MKEKKQEKGRRLSTSAKLLIASAVILACIAGTVLFLILHDRPDEAAFHRTSGSLESGVVSGLTETEATV